MNDRIFIKKHSDLAWSFRDDGNPSISLEATKYGSYESVDPFPCYSHNEELLIKEIEYVEKTLPLKFKPKWFSLPYEFLSRTNASAQEYKEWDANDKTVLAPYIIFSGKRICIHPCMTRYLVAHEYGHVVDYNIQDILKVKNDEFDTQYAEFRGIPNSTDYGAQKWHNNVGEVIANDIRIILLNREEEFWPHDCEHPNKIREKLETFWRDKLCQMEKAISQETVSANDSKITTAV